jgi:uncharacterized protein (TIGR03437 family)
LAATEVRLTGFSCHHPDDDAQVIVIADGPAVTHSTDFTLVSPSKPAAAGEILSLFATGLGPVVPGLTARCAVPFEFAGDG